MIGDALPVYQARYGWDRKTIAVVTISVIFTTMLLLPGVPLLARVLGLPLFGAGGLFMAYTALSRKVAFRVDATGVLLGGNPARYRATTVHVPWGDITGFVLWRQSVGGGATLPYIGIARHADAPALPGDRPMARAAVNWLVPVPAEVAMCSRAVNGWHLDVDQLTAAVAYFAPGVPVRHHPRP
ncbi:hypothetical protein [Streptomyces indicus]|uniref:Uncharacterized protein n=1 Tax=Streptomyces indicus TaxID=417292 RepID=A0A1G9GPU0_9ACTN|nr:hypothetical protein [Streptomyces indicus]SDL02687.1 hypothetical protein SAMN05421806_116135 [Streptomyces indicus]